MNSASFVRPLVALGALTTILGSAAPSEAITRDEVMVRARAFANHPWRCAQKNLTASCASSYDSVYTPGDYVGLPYDWGGYVTLFEFDQGIANGAGAGSYPADGVLDCTVGLDCSGYVSKCWDTGHLTTSSLHTQSTAISQSELLAGDVFNQAGYHVILYSHELANGNPVLYEAVGYNVHINVWWGWAYTSGYEPRRYDDITGSSAGAPEGTPDNPIEIPSFPYTDSRDTTQSSSDVLDGCGAASGTDESGPEYVYVVTFTEPGQVTVGVSDDIDVDIDVHLYESMNTNDCIARDDATFTAPVDCGTYYIVADTYGSGTANAGPYTLNVTFAPSGDACGSGPAGYDPGGSVGEACGFPGHEDLPFCNPNLGGDVCIYTSGTSPISFCSHPCADTSDCGEFPNGCCEDIGNGEFYCLPSSLCSGPAPDAGPDAEPTPDAAPQDAAPQDAAPQDAAPSDDASTDTGLPQDAAPADAASQPDASVPADAAAESAVSSDAGGQEDDASVVPADGDGTKDGDGGDGCGCRTGRPAGSSWATFAALAAALLLARRRRQGK